MSLIDYRYILKRAEGHGWVNPRRAVPPSISEVASIFAAAESEGGEREPGDGDSPAATVGHAASAGQNIGRTEVPSGDGEVPKKAVLFLHRGPFVADTRASYLIQGVLPSSGLGVLVGQPGHGKTFVARDFAFAVSQGLAWEGRKVRKRPTAYVAAENYANIHRRFGLKCEHDNIKPPLDLSLIEGWIDLMDEARLADLTAAINATNAGFVIIDTLSQATVMDENDARDMSKAVRACKRIQQQARDRDLFVLLIHHTGKDASRGARGHSSLKGATDVELIAARDGDFISLKGTKSREGKELSPLTFEMTPANVKDDDEGYPMEHVILVPKLPGDGPGGTEGPSTPATRTPKGLNQQAALAVFQQTASPRPGVPEVPEGSGAVLMEDLVAELTARLIHVEATGRNSKEAMQRMRAKEAVVGLVTGGFVFQVGPWIVEAT